MTTGATSDGAGELVEIPVGALTFRARVAGPEDGRLVLLLHGFPESSSEWRHQLGALADAGYRAVAPDQRGYSPGARPEGVEHYGVRHLIADVLAIADGMGGHQVDLVGHDWGGMVAWLLAAEYPERLRSLTVVSTPHPVPFAKALLSPTSDQRERSSYITFFQTPDAPEQSFLADDAKSLRELYVNTGLDRTTADEYVRLFQEPGALTAALNWYRAFSFTDATSAAGSFTIRVPTLYVWGDGDFALGREAAEGTGAEVQAPYTFEVLAGVGHWVPELAPDQLNAVLLRHLASTG